MMGYNKNYHIITYAYNGEWVELRKCGAVTKYEADIIFEAEKNNATANWKSFGEKVRVELKTRAGHVQKLWKSWEQPLYIF